MTRLRSLAGNLEEVLGVIILILMLALAFANVITRYFFTYPLAFTEEVEVAALVWITMFGAAAGFRRGIHLGFTFLAERFPTPLWKGYTLLSAALTIFIFCLLCWFSLVQMKDEIAFGVTTEALGIPHWIYTLAIPIGFIIIVARILEATAKALRGRKA